MKGMGAGARKVPMSETEQFWLYAKEAILSISYAQTDEDKQGLLDLARVWTVAALRGRSRLLGDHNCGAELSADFEPPPDPVPYIMDFALASRPPTYSLDRQ